MTGHDSMRDTVRADLARIFGPEIMHDALETGEARSCIAARRKLRLREAAFRRLMEKRLRAAARGDAIRVVNWDVSEKDLAKLRAVRPAYWLMPPPSPGMRWWLFEDDDAPATLEGKCVELTFVRSGNGFMIGSRNPAT